VDDPQIPVFDVRVTEEDLEAVAEVLRSGWLTMGPRTEEFERRFAEHLGVSEVVAMSSCTAALHVACVIAGVGEGDEVIVPSMTFAATANAVRYCGARPVFADIVSERDFGIDVDHVESLITERTRAVIPVHYAGYSVEIERLVDLCAERGLGLIEDTAHAPWAHRDGRHLGTFAQTGCFSFFPNKVLGVGEGGALATDATDVADRARRLRSQGMTASTRDRHLGRAMAYDVVELGFNYRFDDPRAALLVSRFARLGHEIERRRALVKRYNDSLSECEGILLPFGNELVDDSSCYLMGVLVEDPSLRSALRRRLMEDHGVQTTVYPAVHRLSAYREAYGEPAALPKTERVADSLFSIPLFPHMDEETQGRVIAAVKDSVAAVGAAG
jgi:dTDP-4-amino-4,6-dideoxygalactose transaminase